MATKTSTIRVPKKTRDMLAQQAQCDGVSLAALLTQIASQRELEAIWKSEQEASRIDASDPLVAAEEEDWSAVLEDGVD